MPWLLLPNALPSLPLQERAALESAFRRPSPPLREHHHAAFAAWLDEASAQLERALQVCAACGGAPDCRQGSVLRSRLAD